MKSTSILLALLALALPAPAQNYVTAHAQRFGADDPSLQLMGRAMDVDGTTMVASDAGLTPLAIVFEKVGDTWQQVAILEPGSSSGVTQWGNSVAIDGDRIAVGGFSFGVATAWTYERNGGAWGTSGLAQLQVSGAAYGAPDVAVSGDRLAIGNVHAEAAGVFALVGGTWTLEKEWTGTSAYGNAVALDGDTFAVSVANAQHVRVYEYANGEWSKVTTLTTGGTKDLDIDGERLVAGTYFSPSKIYHRVGGTWTFMQDIVSSDGVFDDEFGRTVALAGDHLVVGASSFDGAQGIGQAYLFAWDGAAWNEVAILRPDEDPLYYGFQVGLVGTEILVSEVGFSEFHSHPFGPRLGTSYCVGGTNSLGTAAAVFAFGSSVAAEDEFHLGLELAVPNQFAIPIFGPGTSQTPLGDGFLCVTPPTRLGVLKLDAAGAGYSRVQMLEKPVLNEITNVVPITMNFQLWYRDQGSSNLTDAVEVLFN